MRQPTTEPGIATLAPTQPTQPTQPAPAGLAVSAAGVALAQLTWPGVTGAASYSITRSDASGASVARTPAAFTATTFTDTVPDPRQTYSYRLSAIYPNGSWGQSAPVSFQSPPPVNPRWMRAAGVPNVPGSVDLSWDTPSEAPAFLVMGPGIPAGAGTFGGNTIRIFNVPAGPRSWRVAGAYPGGYADTSTAPAANLVIRTLPRNSPAFLSKPAGTGDYAAATAHANVLGARVDSAPMAFNGYLGIAGHPINQKDLISHLTASYRNVTDLGKPRNTECEHLLVERVARTICWSTSLLATKVQITMIVVLREGMQFAAFEGPLDPGDPYSATKQVVATALDAEGPKLLPFSCISCHGGTYDPDTKLVKGATMLPVDPSILEMGHAGTIDDARRINELVLITSPSVAVRNYILGLYNGQVAIPGTPAVVDYVPPSWRTQNKAFYLDVVRKTCVTCHLNGPANLEFTQAKNFFDNGPLVHAAVCRAKSMPHAELPFTRFWTEDTGNLYLPGLLAALLGFPSC